MKRPYPRPWEATGNGSLREIRPAVWRIKWRPFGVRGGQKTRTIACSKAEAQAFLARQAINRSRERAGLPILLHWNDARQAYDDRLQAKNVGDKYRDQVLQLIDDLAQFSQLDDVALVRPHLLQEWIDARVQIRGQARTGWARTANKELAMIGGFFRRLFKQRLIEMDPVAAVDRFREEQRAPRDLQPAEYAAVWQACEQEVRDLLDFFLITAARFGEVRDLKRADIDGQGRWTAEDRKGGMYLRLQLPPELIAIVLRQPKSLDGLVFHRWVGRQIGTKGHGSKTGTPLGVEWWNKVLRARCDLAKVPPFQGHALRHAAASWARRAGCSPWYIQSLLGHAALTTTLGYVDGGVEDGTKVVQKTLLDMRREAIQKLQA